MILQRPSVQFRALNMLSVGLGEMGVADLCGLKPYSQPLHPCPHLSVTAGRPLNSGTSIKLQTQ